MPPYLRHKQHPAAAAHNLLVNLLGHGFGIVPRIQERRRVVDAHGHACAHPAGTDADGLDPGGVVAHFEFGGQTFMQGDGGGLGAGIRDYAWGWGAGGYGGDGDDGAVVGGHHGRDKLSDQAEMGEDVDLEDLGDGLLGGLEEGLTGSDTCVVDENSRYADVGTDRRRAGGDFFRRGNVTLEKGDIWCCFVH